MAQTKITSGGVTDLNITADKLSNTLDLSSKTVTLPTSALSYPTFTSVTPSVAPNDLTSLVIVGTNFGATGIPAVEFQNSTGVITAASSVVRDSATQLTVGCTLPTDGTYFIRIELNTGLAVRSSTAVLTISDVPAWTTGAGSLATVLGDFSGTVATVAATGDTVTFSETTDVLENASLANCTLNSSTGVITTTDFGGSSTVATTYTFTIRATDAQGQTADREFTVTSQFGYTPEILVIAGGGSGGYTDTGYAGGGGGSGGISYHNAYTLMIEGTDYSVVVGEGGPQVPNDAAMNGEHGPNGENSVFGSGAQTILTGFGGGGGAGYVSGPYDIGASGGSGGGSEATATMGSVGAVATQGTGGTTHYGKNGGSPGTGTPNNGARGGGGTDASTGYPGADSNGGPGTSDFSAWGLATTTGNNRSGTVYYASGGNGGVGSSVYGPFTTIPNGGGGIGGTNLGSSGGDGIDGTGSGGGGRGRWNAGSGHGGAGGDGIVIIKRLTAASSTTSGTVSTSGLYTYHVFTADGTYTS